MNKLLTKIAGVALGLTMAIGVGVAVGTSRKDAVRANAVDSVFAQAIFNASNNNSSCSAYTETWTNSTNGFTWELANFNNNGTASGGTGTWSYVKCGRKNNASTAYIATSSSVSNAVSKVSITIDALTASKINSITLYSGTSKAAQTTSLGTFTKATGTKEISISSPTANLYYTIVFDCASGSSNGLLTLSNVSLYQDESDVYPTSISCSAQNIHVLDTVNLANAVTFTNSGGKTVTVKNLTYAIASGSDYIDLDTSNGVVTGKKGGTATVTITADTDSSGNTTSCTATINVSSIAASGLTIGDQYALYAVDSTDSYEGELTGVSSSLGTVAQISDETPSCDYLLTVGNGYYENTVTFDLGSGTYLSYSGSSNALHTSSTVSATSSWKVTWDSSTNAAVILNAANLARSLQFNYNNGNTPRFACYTSTQVAVSLYHYVVKELEDFTIDATLSVYKGATATIGVTYEPADAADKTLSWSSDDTSIATVDSNGVVTGVAVGTTTVTAYKVIDEVNVERTCTVTVLNNAASHTGLVDDPFDVNDAVNFAKGIFTKDVNGDPLYSSNYYYVKGLITANVNRTTSTLTFWIGDNASQTNAANGGFEVFKAAKVYGTALGTYYSASSEVTRDFDVGYYVTVYSTITYYNHTTAETTQNIADIVWNNYIEARTYSETFLDLLSTGEDAVCDADGKTKLSDLVSAWGMLAEEYADNLSSEAKALLSTATSGSTTDVQKTIALYTYIGEKYGHQLETEDLTNFDFMGRNVTPKASAANLILIDIINSKNGSTAAIIVVSLISVTALGGYFFLKKKKEQ